MTGLGLTLSLVMGADPYPTPPTPPLTIPVVPEKRMPLHPVENMRAKVAQLALTGTGKTGPTSSYLWQPSYSLDHVLHGSVRPYIPQPGDIVMAADTSVFWKAMHNLAGTGDPTH